MFHFNGSAPALLGPGMSASAAAAKGRVGRAEAPRCGSAASEGPTHVEDVELDDIDAFLKLRPVWCGSSPAGDGGAGHWGFVAAEVAEIDPRLVHFAYPDDAYESGTEEGDGSVRARRRLRADARPTVPESVAYDRMTVLLQAVVKRQQAELETLEEELCALAVRVEALEDRG